MRFTPYRMASVGSPTGFKYRETFHLFKQITVTRRVNSAGGPYYGTGSGNPGSFNAKGHARSSFPQSMVEFQVSSRGEWEFRLTLRRNVSSEEKERVGGVRYSDISGWSPFHRHAGRPAGGCVCVMP